MPSNGGTKSTGIVVLAAGGYRSGSTLQYNLVGGYLERANLGRRIGLVDPPVAALLRDNWSIVEALRFGVAKCHHVITGYRDFQGHEMIWRDLWAEGRVLVLYTVRDWRDVCVSMCRKFRLSLIELFDSKEWNENLANMDAWLSMQPLVQRYENLMSEPGQAVREFCESADIDFSTEASLGAQQDAALQAQKAVAESLSAGAFDARTLIHWDHISTPEGRSWQQWSDAEKALAHKHLDPLMARFGYDWGSD